MFIIGFFWLHTFVSLLWSPVAAVSIGSLMFRYWNSAVDLNFPDAGALVAILLIGSAVLLPHKTISGATFEWKGRK